jgi:hypothetical protein
MHASQSKAQTFRSSCARDGSIYAPILRARDHTTLSLSDRSGLPRTRVAPKKQRARKGIRATGESKSPGDK